MERSRDEIITDIKNTIDEYITPAVAEHGGMIEFKDFDKGTLTVILGGACSGCAGSFMTLQNGVEQMITASVPEVKFVDAEHDQNSTVDPYYSDHQNPYQHLF